MSALSKRFGRASLGLLLLGSVAGCGAGGAQRGSDVASRLRIASVAEASGQPEVALSVLNSLASTAPDNADVQARFARALARSGRVADAGAALSQALRRKPGDAGLLLELGRIRLLEGNAAEAADTFGAVLAARPGELGATLGRGIAQDLLGQHPQAQESYRAVLSADPQNLPALNNLALSMVLAGDPGNAVPVLQRLAARGDAPPRVRNNLSVAQAAVGERGAHAASPLAAAAPRFYENAPSRAVAATAQREVFPRAALTGRDLATPVGFTAVAAFTDGVVAMEPIPDRSQDAKRPIKNSSRSGAAAGR